MNTKNNQRFQETERRMEACMLELMKHYEFEKITVKKICEKAQVNRSTFYAHFIDIFDIILLFPDSFRVTDVVYVKAQRFR